MKRNYLNPTTQIAVICSLSLILGTSSESTGDIQSNPDSSAGGGIGGGSGKAPKVV